MVPVPVPESADGEFDDAAPAGTTCVAAVSSPAFSRPYAHRTSSAVAHTPVMNAIHPQRDLFLHSNPAVQNGFHSAVSLAERAREKEETAG